MEIEGTIERNSEETFDLPVDEPFTLQQVEVIKSAGVERLRQVLREAPVDEPFTASQVARIATQVGSLSKLSEDLELPISAEEWVSRVTQS